MLQRFRVALARLLTRGTKCTVVRAVVVENMQDTARRLEEYVQRSGGLQDPRRISAWREVFSLSRSIYVDSLEIEVGHQPQAAA